MSFLSLELIWVILTISVIIYFQLIQRFIIWLLKQTKIYLPPTDKDFELIMQMKKDKGRSYPGNAIVRSCSVEEYIGAIKDENIAQSDIIIFFFMIVITNLILLQGWKIFNLVYQESDSEYTSTNIISSFVLMTIFYFVNISVKSNFKKGYLSYDAKIFYIFMVAFVAISFVCLTYFEEIFYFNNKMICDTVNSRINNIYETVKLENKFIICTKTSLDVFYSFIFGIVVSSLYRAITKLSIFDDLLINTTIKVENIFKQSLEKKLSNDYKFVQFTCKSKQILNITICLVLVDPLLKNIFTGNQIMSDLKFYLWIILPLILLEFGLNIYCLQFYATLYLNNNYYEMIDFCKTPEEKFLINLKVKMDYINKKFWEIFNHMLILMFTSVILFLFYVDSSDAIHKIYIKKEKFHFKENFIETSVYFILLAFSFSKGIIGNVYSYYLKKFKNNTNIIYI